MKCLTLEQSLGETNHQLRVERYRSGVILFSSGTTEENRITNPRPIDDTGCRNLT